MYLIKEIYEQQYKIFDFKKEQEANNDIIKLARIYSEQGYDYFHYSGYITRFLWENDEIRNNYKDDLSFLRQFKPIKAFWYGGINTDLKYIEDLDVDLLEYLSIYFDNKHVAQLRKSIKKDLSFVVKFRNLKFLALCPDPISPITIKNVTFSKLKSLVISNDDISNVEFDCFPVLESLNFGSPNGDLEKCNLGQLKHLRALGISGFNQAQNLNFLQELEQLEILSISGFKSITEFPDLSNLKKLKWIFLKCKGIENYTPFSTAPNLEAIKIVGKISKDFNVEKFRPVSESKSLKEFGYVYDYQPKSEEKKLVEIFGDRFNSYIRQIFILEGGEHKIISNSRDI